jgi:hypothetical protein
MPQPPALVCRGTIDHEGFCIPDFFIPCRRNAGKSESRRQQTPWPHQRSDSLYRWQVLSLKRASRGNQLDKGPYNGRTHDRKISNVWRGISEFIHLRINCFAIHEHLKPGLFRDPANGSYHAFSPLSRLLFRVGLVGGEEARRIKVYEPTVFSCGRALRRIPIGQAYPPFLFCACGPIIVLIGSCRDLSLGSVRCRF